MRAFTGAFIPWRDRTPFPVGTLARHSAHPKVTGWSGSSLEEEVRVRRGRVPSGCLTKYGIRERNGLP